MLTDRQTRFVEEYLRAPSDAAGAALRAGYSPGRARRQARALLDMPEVRARIERERDAAVRPEQIIRELARIAFADPADFFAGRACHCEPVTDVTGVAIRSPFHGDGGCGLPRQSADCLAMTGDPDPGRPRENGLPRQSADCLAMTGDPAGLRPGSGTGLKLKYTPKRGADGQTVFELSMEREVRIGDKLRALELLSKYLGLSVPPAAGGDGDDGDEPAGGLIVLPEIETEAEE